MSAPPNCLSKAHRARKHIKLGVGVGWGWGGAQTDFPIISLNATPRPKGEFLQNLGTIALSAPLVPGPTYVIM